MNRLLQTLRQAARDEGFVMCRVAPAIAPEGFHRLVEWIDAGYAGEMHYFADRLEAYRHPKHVLGGVRSIIALAYPYPTWPHKEVSKGQGRIARYAWTGDDYHDVIHAKLKRLCRLLRELRSGEAVDESAGGTSIDVRGVIDTAPLMEREIAQLAGLGWRGKNTLLLNKTLGSYFFLACLLTDAELPVDEAFESFHCGTCTACLEACPTDAFPKPGVLDASRCISYLTIEHRGAIDLELRSGIGDWLFGCDVCQDVCPWNKKPARRSISRPLPLETMELRELFSLDDEAFRSRFRKTPLWRPRRRGLLRNAAIVLGNQQDRGAVDVLAKAGAGEEDPVVRGAAVWALGRIGSDPALTVLRNLSEDERDPSVKQELDLALSIRDEEKGKR